MTTVALPAGTGTMPREDRAEATVRAFFGNSIACKQVAR